MAPAAQAPVKRATYDGSRPRFQTLDAWLTVYGNAEYAIYKRDAAPNALSYEEWSRSEHVLGPFLWYTTLDVWEEDSSSDDESDAEVPAFTARAAPKQQPKKLAITNGHRKRGIAKSSPSAAQSKSEDAAAAAKRKRKPKKAYLSEDIVVSDVSDVEERRPAIEAPTSVANVPGSPTSGRRKSGGRKKKQYLSAEIVSPEDEDEDPMAMNGIVASASTANEPSVPGMLHFQVACAPPHFITSLYRTRSPLNTHYTIIDFYYRLHIQDELTNILDRPAPVAVATSETPKGKPGKEPKNKSLSQAIISKDDDELGDVPADATTTPNNAAASPDRPGSSSRRGLRTRTPAQQRPYFHNAQVFDELVAEPEAEPETQPSPPKPKQKLRLTGFAQVSFTDVQEERQAQEEVATLNVNDGGDELMLDSEEPQPPRKTHYKGKGRAWKKTSDDEDQDYKSPVKVRSSEPTRKTGRRKSTQTAEDPSEESASPAPAKQQRQEDQVNKKVDPVAQSFMPKPGKRPRKPRKISHLSEEFVRDDSDTALEELKEPEIKTEPQKTQLIESASPVQKTPKKRGRPRKHDQGSAPKPRKEKTTKTEDFGSAGKSSQASSPAKPAPAPKKTSAAADETATTATNEEKNVELEDEERNPVQEYTAQTNSPPTNLIDLSASTQPRKMTLEKTKVISLSGSNADSDSEPEVISERTSNRRTLASDLQALDDTGKAVTLSGPPGVEAPKPVAAEEAEVVQRPSPPPEAA
ncbi:hypothetical protein PMIN03_011511 [Paraphaeosphaeria minitans]